MVGYKLSKNDWVTPFFVIFRSVREILLVTVFCKHPVSLSGMKLGVQHKTMRKVAAVAEFSFILGAQLHLEFENEFGP